MSNRTLGRPPSKLTGQLPVSAAHSPWWQETSERVRDAHAGGDRVLTVEELTDLIPPYPDGRRPRPRAVARRLLELGAVELVERGPNGSKGRGAKYRILPLPPAPSPEGDEPVRTDEEWLNDAVERMTGGKLPR